MTEIKKRGRPATGLVRTKMLGSRFTQEEINEIKKAAKKNNMPINEFILKKIKENE